MARNTCKASPGAQFKKKDAPLIDKHLRSLEKLHGQRVTPAIVVDDASDPDSPLHRYFQWDDTEAAKQWRLQQARLLINHILVSVRTPSGDTVDTKAWHSVRITDADDETTERAYVSMSTVDSSPELREQVIATAKRELSYWQIRYRQYVELWPIMDAIDKTMGSAARETKRKKKRV